MAQEWNIRPRGHVCSICAQPLEDKKPCVSVLRETESGYERMDCHAECWKQYPHDWEPFSFWEGIYEAPVPAEKRVKPLKKENAEELLRRLVTLEDPAMANVVYVLAVMLERSKILVERDTKPHEGGGVLRIYEHRKTGDTFIVLDPKLRLDQLGEVQKQVVELLSGEGVMEQAMKPPEAVTPPAASEAEPAKTNGSAGLNC